MPIVCNVNVQRISREEFYELDYTVMKLAFAVHKDMGRFWDERIYQQELSDRCQDAGLGRVATEVPIRVSHEGFTKLYTVDLLLNDSALYELKTADALNGEHQKQTLNYILLLGLQYGKLVNFRPRSVQYRFVTTRLTSDRRHHFTIDDRRWRNLDADSAWLRELIGDLLADWGAFLDIDLFYEAIHHFRGGQDKVVKRIEVLSNSKTLGTQRAHLLNETTAFKLSAVVEDPASYERHLHKFLCHTNLRAVQWVNFRRHEIAFATVTK